LRLPGTHTPVQAPFTHAWPCAAQSAPSTHTPLALQLCATWLPGRQRTDAGF